MVGVAQFGRAPGCGPGGRGFKSHHSPHKKIKGHCNTAMAFVPFAPVAQLDRAPDFESVGRPFESGRAYQDIKGLQSLHCNPFFSFARDFFVNE